jgi:hypothetical protein
MNYWLRVNNESRGPSPMEQIAEMRQEGKVWPTDLAAPEQGGDLSSKDWESH